MSFYKLFSISLGFLWSALAVSCSYEKCPCTKPMIRREWRAFTTEEKADWIRAINCLSQLPHDPALTPSVDPSVSLIPPVNTSSSYFDDIVYLHMDLNIRIHFTGLFLPWHRWYVHIFEESLKNKCGYTGVSPYWNWTIDAPDFYESSFWKDSDPVSGLGGWGDPNADFRVPDGGFHKLPLSYPTPHTVRRNFTLLSFDLPLPNPLNTDKLKMGNTSFTASVIDAILGTSAGDFKGFQKVLEAIEGPHSAIHAIVAGDMVGGCPSGAPSHCKPGPTWSPNDPLFFLHHAMVDKIWYDWQSRDPGNVNSFFGGSVPSLESVDAYSKYPNGGPPFLSLDSIMTADGLFQEVTIGDVMNTTGGYLCYVYE
ncbi:Di-copper centre-containing protein [Russula ochroleuca]|jgi:tyrosinase|uniref:Di-copper centre-containing protein n=1 Tax=Russula ochroleuca TaxID=152965 RepID=A0A9P5JY23_9AGAM|nr:Di-copper centre-containing protein [Russula ochroleuca]